MMSDLGGAAPKRPEYFGFKEAGDLARLLRPRSVAVVGGGAWSRAVIDQCWRFGFAGEIWAVHPKRDEIAGAPAVRSVADLPAAPDAVFVGVNRHAAIEVVAALAQRGAGGAVVFASGFSEAVAEDARGGDLQSALIKAADGMPFLGPNCYGFVNALDRVALWPDQHGCQAVDRGVAILTQSSNIAINLTMQQRGLPIAYTVACGNMAQSSQAQIARALLEDERVTALGLHVEGFGDVSEWHALANAAWDRDVPIVVLKVGRSAEARAATVSHTASLAGSDAGAQAFIDHLGIGRAQDVPTFLEALKLLHIAGRLDAPTLSSISCSGGEASLMADTVAPTRLSLPALTDAQKESLGETLGPMVALANPLDYHTYIWRDTAAMTAAWSAMARPDVGMTMSIVDYPHTDAQDWACATEAAINVRAQTGRPFAVAATLPELMPADVCETLATAGVVPFHGLTEAVAAADIAAHLRAPRDRPVAPGADRTPQLVDEVTAKGQLSAFGLSVPKSCCARGRDYDLGAMHGPFAVKAVGLAHKSDQGGVRLGVGPDALPDAVAAVGTDLVLIEEMVGDGAAELLVGVTRDPAHGFVLTLGAGGVLTELWQDTASLLLPAAPEDIRMALSTLRIAPLLNGYRGKPAGALDAVVDAVQAICAFVTAHADRVEEVEVNPLIVTPTQAIAADALIRMATEEGNTHAPDLDQT